MLIFTILQWLIYVILIVFSIITLRILFVFFSRIKKNVVINKSVVKNVFNGKLSLAIILIFFTVSFSLIGGMSLSSTGGGRSVLNKFNENNVYEYELVSSKFKSHDSKMEEYIYQYNDENNQNINAHVTSGIYANSLQYISDTYFPSSDFNIQDYKTDFSTDFLDWMIEQEYDEDFNDFSKLNDKTYLANPIYYSPDNIISDFVDKTGFATNSSTSDYFKYLLDSSNQRVADIAIQKTIYDIILSTNSNLLTTFNAYFNVTPKGITDNKDFQIKVFNENDRTQDVNKTIFSEHSYTDFLDVDKTDNVGIRKTYKVIVQKDYLEANDLKIGDYINFDSTISFEIYDSVIFSEITYPIMGINVLPNKSKQAFIGMTSSEYIEFIKDMNENSYTSITNRYPSLFFRMDNDDHSTKQWLGDSNSFEEKLNNEYKDEFELISKYNTYVDDDFNFNSSYINEIYDISSVESIRAVGGLWRLDSFQDLIHIFIIIFMIIVLIVLAMLISKRINDSGKQLGTLKAMGMKVENIASSYILFPIIIILLGFVLASLASPLVMLMFNSILSKSLYVSFATNPISINFFLYLLIIPMILSIGLAFLISVKTLLKPTLNLLNNTGKNAPNVLVRAAGYATPSWIPFSVSYAGKGLLRAFGKSSLLFVSIFLSVFLTSFVMSSTTMIKKQTENGIKHLNFRTASLYANGSIGQFDVYKMFDEDGNVTYSNDSEPDLNKFKADIEYLSDIKLPRSIDAQYNLYINYIDATLNSLPKTSKGNGEYIESYIMLEHVLSQGYFSSNSEIISSGGLAEWEKTNSIPGKVSFTSMSELTTRWLTYIGVDYVGDKLDFNLINENIFEVIDELGGVIEQLPDIVIGDLFYNQYANGISNVVNVSPISEAINTNKENYDNYNNNIDKLSNDDFHNNIYCSILNDAETFINTWGSKDSDVDIWKLFDDDYKKINSGESLGYIPVIISTQSGLTLQEWVDTKIPNVDLIEKKDDIYTVSMGLPVVANTRHGTTELNSRIKVDIKVVDELFVGWDFGIVTSNEFVRSYIQNYEYNSNWTIDGEQIKSDILTEMGIESITLINGNLDETFKSIGTQMTTYKDYKPEQIDKYLGDDYIQGIDVEAKSKYMTPLSINMNKTSYANGAVRDDDLHKFLLGDLNNYTYTNGLSTSLNLLLSQGQQVYEMIMGLFSTMAGFVLFMAATIILISMKDIIDSSRREVSMLKAFGYSNTKATSLIMSPYVLVSLLALIIAIPLSFISLGIVAQILTQLTGSVFQFTLTIMQWFILIGFVFGLIAFISIIGYISFSKANALEAIQATNE